MPKAGGGGGGGGGLGGVCDHINHFGYHIMPKAGMGVVWAEFVSTSVILVTTHQRNLHRGHYLCPLC